jgi:hypothetical protein
MRAPPGGLRCVEETGRQIGRELALQGTGGGVDPFRASLAALGFHPSVEHPADGWVRF